MTPEQAEAKAREIVLRWHRETNDARMERGGRYFPLVSLQPQERKSLRRMIAAAIRARGLAERPPVR